STPHRSVSAEDWHSSSPSLPNLPGLVDAPAPLAALFLALNLLACLSRFFLETLSRLIRARRETEIILTSPAYDSFGRLLSLSAKPAQARSTHAIRRGAPY